MRRFLLGLAACVGLVAATPSALAQAAVRPDVLMNTVTAEIIAVLQGDRFAGRRTDIANLVQTKVLPLFEFRRMTSTAMGRNWRLASAVQQDSLTAEFTALLVRTYSQALLSYSNHEVEYLPLRMQPGETDFLVRSLVRRRGGEPMTIDYDMESSPEGWKVIDLKVAGVSLVITYRESFAAAVRAGGVEGLLKQLAQKNRSNAVPAL